MRRKKELKDQENWREEPQPTAEGPAPKCTDEVHTLVVSLVDASASRRRGYSVDPTPSKSAGSSASREHVELQFTAKPLGGDGCVLVWPLVSGSSVFLPVRQ